VFGLLSSNASCLTELMGPWSLDSLHVLKIALCMTSVLPPKPINGKIKRFQMMVHRV
jgi:hypothetical protein